MKKFTGTASQFRELMEVLFPYKSASGEDEFMGGVLTFATTLDMILEGVLKVRLT